MQRIAFISKVLKDSLTSRFIIISRINLLQIQFLSISIVSQFFFIIVNNNRRTRIFSVRAIVPKKKKKIEKIEKIQVPKGAMERSRATNNKSTRAKWLGSGNAANNA